jgi:hypothetical protein
MPGIEPGIEAPLSAGPLDRRVNRGNDALQADKGFFT